MGDWLAKLFHSGGVQIGSWDMAIILAYLVGIVGIGCWAGMRRKKHEGDTYFLGGRNITWPIIGAALFASNISTLHMVSLAECGYTSGLLYGNFEWMAPFTLICLSLFFAPFYIRSGVATLPDFLEKRYNRTCRDWLALLSIFAAIVIHIGFAFFAGAVVLEGMLGIDRNVCILVVAALAGLYTIVGGLLAVMWTESIQTIILLVGAICIVAYGLFDSHVGMGGWSSLKEYVHPVNFSLIRPGSDPTGLSMWAVFLGYPIIGLWYWCCDQVIVQRVLAAKDENHARIGPLFTGFIKILPMFIFVLPGLICLGLVQKGVHADPMGDPKTALTYLIRNVLPIGVKGLFAAALLAAMMGSVSAALNSIATVFSYDIVKRWWPNTSEHALVRVGRIVTAGAMVLSIAWAPFIGNFPTIFQGLNDLICYMAPPVTAVFLFGVFWRRTSSLAAMITLFSGAVLGVVVFVVAFFQIGWWQFLSVDASGGLQAIQWTWSEPTRWTIHSMISGFYMFLIAAATLIVCSLLFPHRHTAESAALVWKSFLDPLRGKSWRWLGNYRVVAVLLFVTMVGLYWTFSGDRSYYPVEFEITLADGTPVRGAKVTFHCDDPALAGLNNAHFSSVVTDKDGRCGFGSKSKAGGLPADAVIQLSIAPAENLCIPLTGEELTKTLAEQRPGATFRMARKRTLNAALYQDLRGERAAGLANVYHDLLETLKQHDQEAARHGTAAEEDGEADPVFLAGADGTLIRLGQTQHLMLLPKTAIHPAYADVKRSGLQVKVKAEANKVMEVLSPQGPAGTAVTVAVGPVPGD